MNLREVLIRPVVRFEEQRYRELMQEHHYLGSLPKISETLWYIALFREQWVALLGFSAAAWKCAARDQQPFPDPSRLARPQFGFSHFVVVPKKAPR